MEEISISGPQLVIGQHLFQPDKARGAKVQLLLTPLPEAEPHPAQTALNQLPAPLPNFLGREAEIVWAVERLTRGTAVIFYGESGVGKTALLRHLAHQPFAEKFAEGIIYLSAAQRQVEDILQSIYGHFYESTLSHKPTSSELRQRLQDKKALIVLDDFSLRSEDLRLLLNAAPSCSFLVASTRRIKRQEGARLLTGLPVDEIVALVTQLWGPLSPAEEKAAAAMSAALKGHPLRLKQVVAAAKLQTLSLPEIAAQLPQETAVADLNLRQLGQQMIATFDRKALQDLCAALEIDYKSLPENGVAPNVPLLLDFVAQENMLPALMAHCEQAHPDVTWSEPTQAILDEAIAALPAVKHELLNLLAAFGDRPISESLLSYLSDGQDVAPALADLLQAGFVQNSAYHLARSLVERLPGEVEPVLQRVVEWVRAHADDEAALLREAQTLAYLQQWAVAHDDAEAAWTLGRTLEEVVALNGRWDLWQQLLYTTQAAAQAMKDTAGEAWTLNQLGCRAMCLGIDSSAQTYLARARQLNEKLGDEAATAVNQHNLDVMKGPPPKPSPWSRRLIYLIGGGVLLLGLLLWFLLQTTFTPPAVPTPTATATEVILQTLTPLPTQTPESSSRLNGESLTPGTEALALPAVTPEPQTALLEP